MNIHSTSAVPNVEVSLSQLPYLRLGVYEADPKFNLILVGSSNNESLNRIKDVYNQFVGAEAEFAEQIQLREKYYVKLSDELAIRKKGGIKPFLQKIGLPTKDHQNLLKEIKDLRSNVNILSMADKMKYEQRLNAAKKNLVNLEEDFIGERRKNPHDILTDLFGGENEYKKLELITFERPDPIADSRIESYISAEMVTSPIMRGRDEHLGEDFVVIRCKKTTGEGFLLFIHEKMANDQEGRLAGGFMPHTAHSYRVSLENADDPTLSRLAELILLKKTTVPRDKGQFEFVID